MNSLLLINICQRLKNYESFDAAATLEVFDVAVVYASNSKEQNLITNGLRALGQFLRSFYSFSDSTLEKYDVVDITQQSYKIFTGAITGEHLD